MSFLYMSFSASCIVLFTVILRGLFKRFLPIELFCGLWWLAMIVYFVVVTTNKTYKRMLLINTSDSVLGYIK